MLVSCSEVIGHFFADGVLLETMDLSPRAFAHQDGWVHSENTMSYI